MSKKKFNGPKVLFLDIETSYMKALIKLWDLNQEQRVHWKQVIQPSVILSCAAKWYQDHEGNVYGPHNKVMYKDRRKNKNFKKEDKKLLLWVWNLLDEADIVIGQNSEQFDIKRLFSAFRLAGIKKRPSSFKQQDTLKINRRVFKHPTNKLEYVSETFNKKYKKQSHSKYPGMTLWDECLASNNDAWNHMKKYNCHDVLATEEEWQGIQAWDPQAINFNIYHMGTEHVCRCGSRELKRNGYAYTATGMFQRYVCKKCGAESRDSKNLLTKEKRESLKRNVSR